MSIKGQGYSLTLVKGHSDFKVKCLTFGLFTQVSDSGPLGPLALNYIWPGVMVSYRRDLFLKLKFKLHMTSNKTQVELKKGGYMSI